jgi:hypothetical protein
LEPTYTHFLAAEAAADAATLWLKIVNNRRATRSQRQAAMFFERCEGTTSRPADSIERHKNSYRDWSRRSAVRGPAPLVGAIGRVCEVHHGSDLSERNAVLVQVRVDLLGNVVWRPTPPEIVADEVRRPDEGLLVARRPSEAGAA